MRTNALSVAATKSAASNKSHSHGKLSLVAVALYEHITPVCWKTEEMLADELRVSRTQIRNAKLELEEAGCIIINYYRNKKRRNPKHEIVKVPPQKRTLSKSVYGPALVGMWSELSRLELIELYLNSRWEIVPFEAKGKKPALNLPMWRQRHKTIESVIDYFYMNPDLNVGLAVKGITVIDVDTKEIPDYFSSTEFDNTLTSETGRGYQFFFEVDPVVKTSVKILSDCADTRCDGSFVVLPPSVHESGFQYRWVTCGDLEKLPITVRRMWRENYFKRCKFGAFSLPPIINEGRRNDTLFRHGRSLRARGQTFAEIKLELHLANDNRCQPPLGTLEMRRLLRDVWFLPDRKDYTRGTSELG